MKNKGHFLFCLLLINGLLFSQSYDTIDEVFVGSLDKPGYAIGVYGDGQILFQAGYGVANFDYDIPIKPESVFDICSVSKQFTAACIVILQDQGKLAIDDPVKKYIPELPEYPGKTITLRHLLNHTSGIRDYLTLIALAGGSFDDYFTEEMGLDIIKRQKELNFQPGEEYLYSNSGYLLLAVVVRRVSGMSIGDFCHKEIFEPLGMTNTFVYEDGYRIVKNRAIGYAEYKGQYVREHHVDFVIGGDGQVYTTVEDFFKWSENLRDPKIGGETFMDELLIQGVLNDGETLDYALGIVHGEYEGLKTIAHGGAWGGFRAYFVQFPLEDRAIAVFSNLSSANPRAKAFEVADIILKEHLKDDKPEPGEDVHSEEEEQTTDLKEATGTAQLTGFIAEGVNLEMYVGEYLSQELDAIYDFYIEEELLMFKVAYEEPISLSPVEEDEFTSEEMIIRFDRQNGVVTGFNLDAGRVTNLEFVKL